MKTLTYFEITQADGANYGTDTVAVVATQALADEAAVIIGDSWNHRNPAGITAKRIVVAETLADIDHPRVKAHLAAQAAATAEARAAADPEAYAQFLALRAQFEPTAIAAETPVRTTQAPRPAPRRRPRPIL